MGIASTYNTQKCADSLVKKPVGLTTKTRCSPNNALGFTAVLAGYTYSSYDYGNLGEVFCTMHQVGASAFVGYSVTYSSSYISRRETTKVSGCHLRCVQDTEE